MNRRVALCAVLFLLSCLVLAPRSGWGEDLIPKAAWHRAIGAPLADAGTKKPTLGPSHIDDGYWQGAPVGGFGAGTFSRDYRGDFSRWHLKAGVHKYQTINANQFAMYQKAEGASEGVAQVLTADHPAEYGLSGWKRDYPVGAGDYYALYPKSWFDYRWDKFPAHVVLEQFSPIVPDNYRETSYPVAVYRWHAENTTNRAVTVSVLLSWANMVGWFRSFSRDLSGGLDAGNRNRLINQAGMKGILFDRNRNGAVQDEWDGQFAIAALESPGLEITYQTTYLPGDAVRSDIWKSFASDGRLANSDQN